MAAGGLVVPIFSPSIRAAVVKIPSPLAVQDLCSTPAGVQGKVDNAKSFFCNFIWDYGYDPSLARRRVKTARAAGWENPPCVSCPSVESSTSPVPPALPSRSRNCRSSLPPSSSAAAARRKASDQALDLDGARVTDSSVCAAESTAMGICS